MTSESLLGAELPAERVRAGWLRFDLEEEVRLLGEVAARRGRNAKTLIADPDVKVVLIILKADSRIPGHQASGRVSIQVVRGHVRIRVGQTETAEAVDLLAGHLLTLERNVRHDVEALADSVFVLTVTSPERAA
jgi:quercetin dioxygenase-like cupin family protein